MADGVSTTTSSLIVVWRVVVACTPAGKSSRMTLSVTLPPETMTSASGDHSVGLSRVAQAVMPVISPLLCWKRISPASDTGPSGGSIICGCR